MKVLKFGGTSIGTIENIKIVVNLINNSNFKIVVLSAFSKVTDYLSEFISQSKLKNSNKLKHILTDIETRHLNIISNLFSTKKFEEIAQNKLNNSIRLISSYLHREISLDDENVILAQGELLSVLIIYLYSVEQELNIAYIPALQYMKTNNANDPDFDFIGHYLNAEIKKYPTCYTFLTSGFICKNYNGQISNLGRGASDYTATIIGNILNASVIEIWTDTDGIRSNDPRFVEHTLPINQMSYDEAEELAYFGAKILHPASIFPAQEKSIPVLIKNTMNPNGRGTIISDYLSPNGIKGIASKDGITTIKIKSGRMMQAYGFLRRIFEVFEKYKTPVDMLTTSEISVAMTIDNNTYIHKIKNDLSKIGHLEVVENQSIISVVGTNINLTKSIHTLINAFDTIPLQMISYGSSSNNISIVISTNYKTEALNILNERFFATDKCLTNN